MYEPLFKLEQTGVQIHYYTNERKRYLVHWHSAIELIYILNGDGAMMVVLHFSHSVMKNFMPELDEYALHCTRSALRKEQLDAYLKICDLLKKLPPLYIMQK